MPQSSTPRTLLPLYLAGFTTAFGAHGIASVLGTEAATLGLSLLTFGISLALYDLAEVVLKPIFGALSDRIGVKPVILGGLIAFALVSAVALFVTTPLALALIRLGQGAAASAFSPAASAAVARLSGPEVLGRTFGRYGAWKSLGYLLGPVLGIALANAVDVRAVYASLVVLAAASAALVAARMPALPPLPRTRATLADLARQLSDRSFLTPTIVLATTTAVLGTAVGFVPLLAVQTGLHPLVGAGAVSLLALVSVIVQPLVGAARDRGTLGTGSGIMIGLLLGAAALALLGLLPRTAMLFLACAAIGAMLGFATPLAFSHLAASTPDDRMGRTMGSAELGREVGDSAGPLLVGGVGAAFGVAPAMLVLGAATAAVAVVGGVVLRRPPTGSAHRD